MSLVMPFGCPCVVWCRRFAICLMYGVKYLQSSTQEMICEFEILNIHSWQKSCYTTIEDNKTNVDRFFVFPLGWNWHDMDPWLLPNEIRHYLGQTFNARSSGIVEIRNHRIGGRSPKSIFTLWQLWINICIFFKSFSDSSNNAPSNPYGY